MIGLLATLTSQEKMSLISKEFDLHPYQLENLGKVQRLYTPRGSFALKKVKLEQEQAEQITLFFQELKERQFPYFNPPLPSKYGDSLIPLQGEYYYVTTWLDDHVEIKYRNDWELLILEAMAKLHALSAPFAHRGQSEPSLTAQELLNRWHKRLIQMNEFKSFAQDRSFMSPIEMVFVEQFEYLQELGLRATKYLQEWQKRVEEGKHVGQLVLCHGYLHRNHVLHGKKKELYIINFDHARIDSPARDLALFYRRHLDKAFEDESTALEWLRLYEEHFPLNRADKMLLAIYLLFPERVFKEVENYYEAVRTWHPLKHARFLEKQIKYTHVIRHFVSEMLS